ncbi:M20 family metallo-hydrolase [Cyclobacterium jeungdonense]|uniref:M20 family metallo-hydrolase n=1 Tax=Cyclobacterium jeungdonense TaxID=708087 RepID=A0ABT8CBM8_9BACT|nr:M20 family metallo-hydrolase [Cyclobacterium jeungdonense]MDN3689921.1 M20 family metallo-hydrolase [Cyclobacterium jeungdonense]
MESLNQLHTEALELLKDLIRTPSLSRSENQTAAIIRAFLEKKGVSIHQKGNNIWAYADGYDPARPTVMLNSHHDTVKPNQGYTLDPFEPIEKDGKLFGLGSNDAGGSLVALIAAFMHFRNQPLPVNLLLVASAEEEISGKGGIESLIPELPELSVAVVGEPTRLKMAVAEKGLMVIDALVKGKAGHAAREEGLNAIYEALDDLNAIRSFRFKNVSAFLGTSKVSATLIQAGSQHNVVPDLCTYTLDVRVTDAYTLQEALDELRQSLKAELRPRSMRLNSSRIDAAHPMLTVAKSMGLETFGSPTLSDQALIPYPSVKIGPGDSARSHTPDEFIYVTEIKEGISLYIALLETYFSKLTDNKK